MEGPMQFDWIKTNPARLAEVRDRIQDALTNVSWSAPGTIIARAQQFAERLRPVVIIAGVGLAFLLGVDTGIDYQKTVSSQRAAAVPLHKETVKPRQAACHTRRCL